MTHSVERKSDAGTETLPVFYVIRLVEQPGQLYGGCHLQDCSRRPLTLYLFKSEPDGLECLTNRHPDPDTAEVVGSDKFGGILPLLSYASQTFPYVTLNPPLTVGASVPLLRMDTFIRRHVIIDAVAW